MIRVEEHLNWNESRFLFHDEGYITAISTLKHFTGKTFTQSETDQMYEEANEEDSPLRIFQRVFIYKAPVDILSGVKEEHIKLTIDGTTYLLFNEDKEAESEMNFRKVLRAARYLFPEVMKAKQARRVEQVKQETKAILEGHYNEEKEARIKAAVAHLISVIEG